MDIMDRYACIQCNNGKDEIKLLLYNTHEKIIKSHNIKEIEI